MTLQCQRDVQALPSLWISSLQRYFLQKNVFQLLNPNASFPIEKFSLLCLQKAALLLVRAFLSQQATSCQHFGNSRILVLSLRCYSISQSLTPLSFPAAEASSANHTCFILSSERRWIRSVIAIAYIAIGRGCPSVLLSCG